MDISINIIVISSLFQCILFLFFFLIRFFCKNIQYRKVIRISIYCNCFIIFLVSFFEFLLCNRFGAFLPVTVLAWRDFLLKKSIALADEKVGANAYNDRTAKIQKAHFKNLSFDEQNKCLAEYKANAVWIPKVWQLILLQLASAILGLLISLPIKYFFVL